MSFPTVAKFNYSFIVNLMTESVPSKDSGTLYRAIRPINLLSTDLAMDFAHPTSLNV